MRTSTQKDPQNVAREKLLSGPLPRGGRAREKQPKTAIAKAATPAEATRTIAAQQELLPSQPATLTPPWESRAALTFKEVCQFGAISMASLYNEVNAGRLRAVKRGRRSLVLRTDFERWLNELPAMGPKGPAT